MIQENNTIMNSLTEENIIARLKKVSFVEEWDVKDAGRSVALYITGLSEKKVKDHIKKRTFSGANALEHISQPNTPAARTAWSRAKAICRDAGLPIRRLRWEDRPDKDILEMNQNEK